MVVASGTGCVHAPWNPYGGWRVARTKHFAMYTDTRYIYGRTLEPLEIAYAALASSLFKNTPIAPVEVLFLEHDKFVGMLGHYRAGSSHGVAVVKLPGEGNIGDKGLIIVHEGARIGTAAHMLAHMFLSRMAPLAPLWVHEAYATYVETIQLRGSRGSGPAVACLGHLGAGEPTIPLDDLFTWSWGHFDQSKATEWYQTTGSLLIDYFLRGEDGSLRERFALLMARLAKGQDTKSVLAELFPDLPVPVIERRMKEHRKDSEMRPRGLCPLEFPVAADDMADMGDAKESPVPKPDIETLFLRARLLPRRAGYVDFFPRRVLSVEAVLAK